MFDSSTCKSKVTNKPLKSYESEVEAKDAIRYVKETYGNDQVYYKCSECNSWHLSRSERQTPNYLSTCTDSSGKPKHAYESKSSAEKRVKIISDEKGLDLNIYECDDCGKWHLTHMNY